MAKDPYQAFAAGIRKTINARDAKLKRAHRKIADAVETRGKAALAGQPVPKSTAAAAGLTSSSGKDFARIRMLGSNPFIRAVEFGTHVHNVFGHRFPASKMERRVFRVHRNEGYAVRPTIDAARQKGFFENAYLDALMEAAQHGWPVKT